MSPLPLLLALGSATAGPRLDGVVDRIEEDVAVVEWGVDHVQDIPVDFFASPVREGQRVALRARRDPDGVWILEHGRLRPLRSATGFDLPAPPGTASGRRYDVQLVPRLGLLPLNLRVLPLAGRGMARANPTERTTP